MKCGVVSFLWVGDFICWWVGGSFQRTTHSSVFWQCLGTVQVPQGVSLSLQVEDQGLVDIWLVILDPFNFNWFMLCPWAMSFFQKSCPAPFPPVSCSSPEPHPGPQCCLYNLLKGQPENSWTLGTWGSSSRSCSVRCRGCPQKKGTLKTIRHWWKKLKTIKQMERYTMFLDWRNQYCQNDCTTQSTDTTESLSND